MSFDLKDKALHLSQEVMTVGTQSNLGSKRMWPLCGIARQVSQEMISFENGFDRKIADHHGGRGSPSRCVSDFDKVNTNLCSAVSSTVKLGLNTKFPDRALLEQHRISVRLEADLKPLRLILSRLMAHPVHNRKGIFNVPVDPVALGLPDYSNVVAHPMDLGTIKSRLHALAYGSREQAINDIRLVFANAMAYNPANNPVHVAAKALMDFFQDQLHSFLPEADQYQLLPGTPGSGNSNEDLAPDSTETPKVFCTSPGVSSFHSPGTRACHSSDYLLPSSFLSDRKQRRKRGSKRSIAHSCQTCLGRRCDICDQGCLSLEPPLLICNGPYCSGSKIRKGATYFVAPDGSRQFCERCHVGLPPVLLPGKVEEQGCRYKRDLLKRKNDEEVVEPWFDCSLCDKSFHHICAMSTLSIDRRPVGDDFLCPSCAMKHEPCDGIAGRTDGENPTTGMYTFLAGSNEPVPMSKLRSRPSALSAEDLTETPESAFIESKVRALMKGSNIVGAERTIVIRVISDCDRSFAVPAVVRKHFRMVRSSNKASGVPPTNVKYRSKAIMMFQKMDGWDVCIFCMYVQEYEGEVTSDGFDKTEKRVYIAYLDSVEHFRPRKCRTAAFQEVLISYMATARRRGFKTAYIWACPPSRGNSFVFWNHPPSQRTPTQERLVAWYNDILSSALQRGIVTNVKSLYETCFESDLVDMGEQESRPYKFKGAMVCPPLLDGDFWVDEAVRVHSVNMARHQKAKTADGLINGCNFTELNEGEGIYPVVEIAKMLRHKIIAHPDSLAFRRPVNAAALKLKDYHKIVTSPMDLGTIYSKCTLGEYSSLSELVEDVELMVSNAKTFNPVGHIVHIKADDIARLFFSELNALVTSWKDGCASWKDVAAVSLALDDRLDERVKEDHDDVSALPAFYQGGTPVDLLLGGAKAVHDCMVGGDKMFLDKSQTSTRASSTGKAAKRGGNGRRRKSLCSSDGEPQAKRRRQSWLGEEVGIAVRRMRPHFFVCSLDACSELENPELEKLAQYTSYVESYEPKSFEGKSSRIADMRNSLLEFSQFHNLEFDTVRKAKYSTSILLYHLHNNNAPGVIPTCTSCQSVISGVRWHKITHIVEDSSVLNKQVTTGCHKKKPFTAVPEELCQSCFEKREEETHVNFLPVQVTLQ